MADATSVKIALLWMRLLEQTLPDCALAFPELDRRQTRHLKRKIDAAAKSTGTYVANSHVIQKAMSERTLKYGIRD